MHFRHLVYLPIVCGVWLLASCESTKEVKSKPAAAATADELAPPTSGDEFGLTSPPEKTTVEEDTVSAAPAAVDKHKLDPKLLPGRKEATAEVKQAPAFYDKLLKTDKDTVMPNSTLNFDATSVAELVPRFAEILSFNYILDPRVKGTVDMNINTPMTKKELWQLFEQILWACGSYCSPDPAGSDIIHIMPFVDMPKERNVDFADAGTSNVQVVLFHIRNTGSKDILEKLRPFFTAGATAIDIPNRNMVLLVETPQNIPKLRALVKMLDQKNKDGWPQVAIPCVNVSADIIKEELAGLLPVLGFPVSVDGTTAEPGSIHLTSVDRMQVVVASAANNEAIDEIKRWINILDQDDVGEQERVFIYKVVNNQAEQLMQSLQVIFAVEGSSLTPPSGGSSSSSSSSSSNSSGSSSGLGSSSNSFSSMSAPSSPSPTRKAGSSSSSTDKKKTNSVFEIPTKVLADGIHNRLVIRTTPRTYATIKAVLDRLDTVASQVLLQIMIAEVQLDKSTQFGLEFKTSAFNRGSALTSVGTDYSGLNPTKSDQYGFNYYLRDKDSPADKFAYLRALAGETNTKMLSCPQIITQSHTPAEIKVGEKVPIVTQENNTTDTTNITRSIQYVDTGILTNITPHVTKGGLITMDIDQTISDAKKTTTSSIDSPTISERVFKTTLSLRDGDTLLVGGLIWDKSSDSQNNLPYLINVPVLGRMLGYNDLSNNRVEILIMITATVITADSNIEAMLERYKNSMRELRKFNGTAGNG